jgi:rod shape-determining protein MreC
VAHRQPAGGTFPSALVDRVVPSFDWALLPVTRAVNMIEDFQSYARIYEQNQELRRELQQMKAWREAALQLEQQNAKLLDLNQVRLDPRLTHVTGVVLADSGSPFRRSVLLNVGARDGIQDGWAAMDGLGLVGRISGVGQQTSRVILLTDSNSRIPVTIQPSGQRAMLAGDNSALPPLDFIDPPNRCAPATGWSVRAMAACFRPACWWARWRRGRPAVAGAAGGRLSAAGIPARAALAPA